MKSDEIDINQFKSLSELNHFIDDKVYDFERGAYWIVRDLYVKYLNKITDKGEKQKAKWELEMNRFEFVGSEVFSFVYNPSETMGEIDQYPNVEHFQNEALNYLIKRAQEVKTHLMLARYNHFLCHLSKNASGVYINKAIDNYINAIKDYYTIYIETKDGESQYQICLLYERLFELVKKYNSKKKELVDITNFLLYKAKEIQFDIKHTIIEKCLTFPKVFKKDFFVNTLYIYKDYVIAGKKDELLRINHYLPTAISIANKIGEDTSIFYNEIGDSHLRLAAKKDKYDWINTDFYSHAIDAYKKAGNDIKVKEVEKLYMEAKSNIHLGTFSLTIGRAESDLINKYNNDVAVSILEMGEYEIYQTIANGKFFPVKAHMKSHSKSKDNSFLDSIPGIVFDINNNISKAKTDGDQFYLYYANNINIFTSQILYRIFKDGIGSGKLSANGFFSYLLKYTWLGKPIPKKSLGGEHYEFFMIELIAPAIIEFFVQVKAFIHSGYFKPNFVLCLDSLTVKMERVFREFCLLTKIPTSRKGKNGEMQEIYINEIIYNEDIKEYFNEDDVIFFKYLFLNESHCLNLRNNIAHGYYSKKDFSIYKMLLVIAALLRFAKFDITVKDITHPTI